MSVNRNPALFMLTLMLGAIVVWTPAVAAESPVDDQQAHNINVSFDSISEQTIVTWENQQTLHYPAMVDMRNVSYQVYRHNAPINSSVVEEANLLPFANVSACPESVSNTGDCPGISHAAIFELPAGVNGTYYYAIATYFTNNDTVQANWVHGESNVSEGVYEFTNIQTAPFYLQAEYKPALSATDLTWINLNEIIPDSLPSAGDNAYEIHVWRHEEPASRATWPGQVKTKIADLTAGTTNYRYVVPEGTDDQFYYSVTYEYAGYEDVRFLGTNTIPEGQAIHEDNIAPIHVSWVAASFEAEPDGGTGNTTIIWDDLLGETDEEYHIWRSGYPIDNTSNATRIGVVAEGEEMFRYEVERGMLGFSYYAVTVADVNGNMNNSVGENSRTPGITENTFDPWIAEPTNVFAEYNGGTTTITWNDQLGAEGEIYHVWRADTRLTSLSNLTLEATLVATVPDGVQTATVEVPENFNRLSYYCVTSLSRYGHLADAYEDTRFQQNCYGTISEDTLPPSPPFLSEPALHVQGEEAMLLFQWINDVAENGESYHLWAHHGDPWAGQNASSEVTSGDIGTQTGWVEVIEPVVAITAGEPTFMRPVYLADGLDQYAWYALTIADDWGKANLAYTSPGNAWRVHEDTTGPVATTSVYDDDGNEVTSMNAGEYNIVFTVDETLGEFPVVNITTTDYEMDEFGVVKSGVAFTEQTSTVRANPVPGSSNEYQYSFEVESTVATSDIQVTLSMTDASGNTATTQQIGWPIDAQLPRFQVYSPSAQSLYLYGETIHFYGAVTDDVDVSEVNLMFIYRDDGLKVETEWMAVTDITAHTTSNGTYMFEWYEPSATFRDLGRTQTVLIEAFDEAGNRAEWSTTFVVDRCVRTTDYRTICSDDYAPGFEPTIEEEEPEGPFSGSRLMIYALAGVNFILLIVALVGVLFASNDPAKKKRGGDDDEELDEEDEWMMEFMGGDDAAGSPDDVRKDMESANSDASERADVDDPFAASEGRDRKRRDKKKKSDDAEEEAEEEPEPEEDDGDDDDFDDEDDDWGDEDDDEPEEKPKKKPARKAVKRRAVKKRS